MTSTITQERKIRKVGTALKYRSGDRVPIASAAFLDVLTNSGNNEMLLVGFDAFLSDTTSVNPAHVLHLLIGPTSHSGPHSPVAGEMSAQYHAASGPNPAPLHFQAPLGLGVVVAPGESVYLFAETGAVDTQVTVSFGMVYSYQ